MSKVRLICVECALLAGKNERNYSSKARVSKGKCDICKQRKEVTEPHFWGNFTHEQIAKARKAVRDLGMHKDQVANPEDVVKLIDVVEKTLGPDHMSPTTKETIQKLRVLLSLGKPIQVFLTRQLTSWFASDVDEWKKAKRKAKPPKKLLVVEGGIEHVKEIENDDAEQPANLIIRG